MAGPLKLAQVAGERYGAKAPEQVSFAQVEVETYVLEVAQRAKCSGTVRPFFGKPELIGAHEFLIEQMGFVGGENQLTLCLMLTGKFGYEFFE